MVIRYRAFRTQLVVGCMWAAISPCAAADVTPERLANPDREPGNWLTNHRSYDAQRYSPLEAINKTNVKSLKLAYAVAIGGTSANENLQSTPLAEDGFLYIVDQWGVVYKIDGRSGDVGRILWRMDPKQEKLTLANRGVALSGNNVISIASFPPRVSATDKDTGRVVWQTNMHDGQDAITLTAAPLAVKDKIIVAASGGDNGARDWIAALDAATGKLAWRKYVIPAPGEPGSETWKDKNNAWRTGGGAMWATGSYDPATNQVLWGTGNPVPWSNPYFRPGDNLFTSSLISWDADTGKMNWYHQYTPGDMWEYDEVGPHVLIDGEIAGQPRRIIAHAARNGFFYNFERSNGQVMFAKQYVAKVNWTKGIDQKTGKPLDYDPNKDVQVYSGEQNFTPAEPTKEMCPSLIGGNSYFPPSYSRKTRLLYFASLATCGEGTMDQEGVKKGIFLTTSWKWHVRTESDLMVANPFTGDVKIRTRSAFQNVSGVVTTAGGLVFTAYVDGTVAAYDDTTLDEVWKLNLGTGFNAPPITFEANGKQFIAILSGLSRPTAQRNNLTPELRDQRNQTMLFVFGL
jgi:alcohol dehydrogenase (cytochrome c)